MRTFLSDPEVKLAAIIGLLMAMIVGFSLVVSQAQAELDRSRAGFPCALSAAPMVVISTMQDGSGVLHVCRYDENGLLFRYDRADVVSPKPEQRGRG